jgi:hypothetical protein
LESKDGQKIKGFIESLHSTGNDGDEIDLWFENRKCIFNVNYYMDIVIYYTS